MERGVYVHNLLRLIGRSPRQPRNLRHRGLRKLALNSGTTRRSAKNAQPSSPPDPRWKPPVSVHTGKSTNSGDELNWGTSSKRPNVPAWSQRRPYRRWAAQTGTSTTLSVLQLRKFHSFLYCHIPSTCRCTTTGVSTVSKNNTCGISPVFCTGMICGIGIPRSVPLQEAHAESPPPQPWSVVRHTTKMAPRRGSGDAKPLTPVHPVYFTYPGDRQGHPRRVQGMPSPWTQNHHPGASRSS